MNASYLVSAIPPLLELIALVVGAVLVANRSTGTRRRLGVIGLLVLGVVVIFRGAAALTAPFLFRSFGGVYPAIYGVVNAVLSLIWIGGLGLVIAALVARDRPSYPPQPYPYQPGPNQPGPNQR